VLFQNSSLQKAALLLAFPKEEPASELTEAGAILLTSRPCLEGLYLPVGAGGGGGGGAGAGPQQAETPSIAAAKATNVRYLA
jgi:hypothetical protein